MRSDRTKTLVILTPGFAKDESDTTCLPMQQTFIRSLNEKFPQLNIVILAFQYPYINKTYQWFANTVISLNGRNRGGFFKLFLRRKCDAVLKRIHKSNKIDGLLSFWYGECAVVGKRFADKHNIKHYCWMWGQDARETNKYPSSVELKADELIAFSDFLQNEFEKNHGIRPLHVITPGIDTKMVSFNNGGRDIDIIAAGSLIPLKQYDILIQVVSEIKKKIPTVKALLIGDGPEKSKLKNLITSLRLESNITLIGELPHPEVLQWMQRGKVFLHPSSYEGFGVVCIEALCSGAEVISFVKPMDTEIENWHIVPSKEEMIKKAIGIIKEPKTEYKSVIPYTINQSVQKMSQLYSF